MINELKKENLDYYISKHIMVHIVLKRDDDKPETKPKFYNGVIVEYTEKILVIDDRKNGVTPISLIDIFSIENFREINEVGADNGFYQP